MPLLSTRGAASVKAFGLTALPGALPGQQAYTIAGTYTWIAPEGITSVSVVTVGGGGNGGGGLGYINNYAVTPGNSYTVFVGDGGNLSTSNAAQDSYFVSTSVVKGGAGAVTTNPSTGLADGGTYTGTGGGNGGKGGIGGGGAGGYSGNGGQGSYSPFANNGSSGSGGGGGGGGQSGGYNYGGGGGGVGILGIGSNGGGGGNASGLEGGKGGSGGTDGGTSIDCDGGIYGGGSGKSSDTSSYLGSYGAVRIIWPGTTRSFPSTNTGNL